MPSFWERLKAIVGAGGTGGVPPADLARKVESIIVQKMMKKVVFEAIDVADEATADMESRTVSVVTYACSIVEQLYTGGRFEPLGYTRTKLSRWGDPKGVPPNPPGSPTSLDGDDSTQFDGNYRYHPKGVDPATYQAPPPAPKGAPPAAPAKPAPTASPPPPPPPPPPAPAKPKDPLDGGGILGLSAEELRKRALRIHPFRGPWFGSPGAIPPASDERTAIIDRGLILGGVLTLDQINEIHRVGELWERHRNAVHHASVAAVRIVEEALAKRKRDAIEAKARKKKEAEEREARRKAAVAKRRAEDIVYLGPDVSGLLHDRRTHVEALEGKGLPLLTTPMELARSLGLTVPELRWLSYHAVACEKPHYVYFRVKKRSGGERLLSSPQPKLAAAQAWVLRNILDKLPVEAPAHGFIKGRSTVSCAAPHVDRDVVLNLDLSDFFPSIGYRRVRGVFQKMGYSPAIASMLALLCTEAPRAEVVFQGQRLFVAVGDRALPQGACTSPALSNQVAKKLDRRLMGMCNKHGIAYTRYADDLTFSIPAGRRAEIPMILARVRHIVHEEGFRVNPKKGRIQRAGGRQTVTGVVVNDKLTVPRDEVKRIRAILHQAKKTGLDAQNRENVPHFEAHLRGKIAYLHMVDPKKAAPLLAALDEVARPR